MHESHVGPVLKLALGHAAEGDPFDEALRAKIQDEWDPLCASPGELPEEAQRWIGSRSQEDFKFMRLIRRNERGEMVGAEQALNFQKKSPEFRTQFPASGFVNVDVALDDLTMSEFVSASV